VRIFKATALTLATTLLASTPVYAGGLPTFDAVSLTQDILKLKELRDQVQNGIDLVNEAKDTVENTQNMLDSMSGERAMGALFNGEFEKSFREHMPATFNEVLDLENAGGEASSYVASIKEVYQPTNASEIWDDTSTPRAQRYQRGVNYTVNTMAISESAYEVAAQRNLTIEALQEELDKTTDLKASIDLQSRILIEQSYINNELVRLQALALQGQADEKAAQFEKTTYNRSVFSRPSN